MEGKVMVRLTELLKKFTYLSNEYALLFFGRIAPHCLEETEEENKLLEGLSPSKILLNDNWYKGITDVYIEASKTPFTSYAYYPIEYLRGEKWDAACSAYAIFAITYRLMTGELPYIGNVPEELLTSTEGLNYVVNKLKEGHVLDVEKIHPAFQDFFKKGLALDKNMRYQAIGDAAEEYEKLTDAFCEGRHEEETQDSSDDLNDFIPDFNGLFPQNNTVEFRLDVHTAEEGGLDDIVGLDEQKKYFREHFLAIVQNPEKARRYNLFIPNGCLFYGPPGCGKTYCAKMCAAEAKLNHAIVNAPDLASTLVHGSQSLIRQMFEQAEYYAPIVLILDEIETMVPNRNDRDNTKVAEETNAFLSELNDCGRRGIFVIGTTNRPHMMDSAILRSGRFDKRIYFPLPDEQTRAEIFKKYLKDRPLEEPVDYAKLSKLTSAGYISSDIKQICDEVACRAFCEDSIITQELIEQTIKEEGPSVNPKELRLYEESRKYMEPASRQTQYMNHIGFR